MTLQERWRTFSAAPHRMMMFGGALQFVASLAYWLVELTGRYTALWAPLQTTVPGLYAHAFLMLYGLFPFFIFGFLMTTYPRWMNVAEVPRGRYVTAFLLLATGVVAFYLGLFFARPVLLLGLVLIELGFLWGVAALFAVYRSARGRDRHYESILNIALSAGALGIALFGLGLAFGRADWLAAAQLIGTWWFLGAVLVTVAHRMLPFFTINVPGTEPVHRPRGGLPLLLGGIVLHGLLELSGLASWTWVVDVPLLVVVLHHLRQWGIARTFHAPLLAMLHVSFAWLGIAVALSALRSLTWLISGADYLARAPLHAIGIGFIAGMTMAMATRVTLGHSGRALEADRFTWILFWLLGVAAALRVIGEVPWGAGLAGVGATWLAALLLAVVMALWAGRYAPMYIRPRVDGRPG